MSTDYFVYCKTCKERHDFNDANRQAPLMRALVRHACAIAALAPLFAEDPTWGSLRLDTSYGQIDPSWFQYHQGHELAVIDEYGKLDATCGKPFECNECTTRHYCRRVEGHPGGCSSK